MSLREFKGAFESFEQASKSAPNEPIAWLGKGIPARELDRIQDSAEALARAVEANPTDFETPAYLADALLVQGHVDRSLEMLDEVLARNPESLIGLVYKGKALGVGSQKWREALECFEKALSLYPDSYEALTFSVAAPSQS